MVVEVPGDHGLKADLPALSAAVRSWVADLLAEIEARTPAPERTRSDRPAGDATG
jgi:hypothetical protein